MTKPGPSPEYRDLIEGRISPDQYVERLKRAAQERLNGDEKRDESRREAPEGSRDEARSAA